MTQVLSLEDILFLHFSVIEDFGGSHGVRDENRLLSVVKAPLQEAFGVEQYPSVFDKAAVYMRNIIADHPFVDGNKRTGVTVAGIFLQRNRHYLTCSTKQLEDFAVKVAVDKLDVSQIASWLQRNSSMAK